MKGLERVFRILEVPEEQKLRLASFNLTGDALVWWENTERIHTTPAPGVVQQPITWALFVKEFQAKYYPLSYQLDREREFLTFQQDGLTVSEYEAKFLALSRYATMMVDTDEKRCQRFKCGLIPPIDTRLTGYRETSYVDLEIGRAHV